MAVEYDVEADPTDIISQTEDAAGKVEYTADYAGAVNYPTEYSGSSPPFEPIHEWVQRKWGDLSGGLKQAALENVENPSDISTKKHKEMVAWVVVRSIQDTGTEGLYFAERSLKHGQDNAEAIAKKYENSDDPLAPFKAVRDTTQLSFQHSQDIISGDVETGDDDDESAFDEGFLKRSGQAYFDVDGDVDGDDGDWDGGER